MPFTITTKTDFSAAHFLRNYVGDCARLHGHNWEIETEVVVTELDEIGISIDFNIIKSHVVKIIDKLDHYNLNDIPPFDKINPTAENLAKYFFDELKQRLTNTPAKINAIVVWETKRASARYTET